MVVGAVGVGEGSVGVDVSQCDQKESSMGIGFWYD